MPKKLKVHFSGICTYASTAPDSNDTFDRLFVIAPRAREHRLTRGTQPGIVARHRTFVSVPKVYLTRAAQPAISVVDSNLQEDCGVFLVNNARLTFNPAAVDRCKYVAFPNTDVFGWPDTNGSAPGSDSRWIPAIAEIFTQSPPLLAFDPRGTVSNDLVGMIVEITGASLEGGVPCTSAQPRTFPGTGIPPRVMSVDLIATMEYPDTTLTVTLKADVLDPNGRLTGLGSAGIELQWPPSKDTITLRMGNDTLDEIVVLGGQGRCNADVDVDVDFDFDLHYDVLTNVTTRPLPTPSGHEGDWGGCVGLKVPTP